jgi:RNA recognition motif-containing protein
LFLSLVFTRTLTLNLNLNSTSLSSCSHKGFGFVEYECPEAATLAIELMAGQTIDNRPIRVGRPKPAEMPDILSVEQAMANDPVNKTRVCVNRLISL